MAKKTHAERIFEGLGVSPGIAIGPAHLREAGEIQVPEYKVPEDKLEDELGRFRQAVAKAVRQVGKLKAKSLSFHGAAAEELGYLLDAHRQMLKSSRLIGGIEKRIRADSRNAESAVMAEISSIAQDFAEMEDPYLRTRAQEVREVGHRILRGLTETAYESYDTIEQDSVILAEEITPSDTALMDPALVAGFATVLGGAEGHTAIMARSLGLPAVLGVPHLTREVQGGDQIIVDGSNGLVIVNPTAKRLADYEGRARSVFERLSEARRQLEAKERDLSSRKSRLSEVKDQLHELELELSNTRTREEMARGRLTEECGLDGLTPADATSEFFAR